MSAEIIDITKPLEDRQFKAKEDRLKKIKAAFKKARMEALVVSKKNQFPKPSKTSASAKKKNRHPGK